MRIPHTCLALAAFGAFLVSADSPAYSGGKCSQITHIQNDSGIVLRFSELKSSSSTPPVFKSQWTGSRVIASGATDTINWTSDSPCTDPYGVPNHWDVKLFRNNGNEHFCGKLGQSQSVRVNTPELCFPN